MGHDNNDFISIFKKLKNLTAVGTANLFANGIASLFWIYLATLLGKESYGELGYLLAVAGTASAFASLGSVNTLIVYRSKRIEIQGIIFFLVLVASAITALLIYFIVDNIAVSIYPIGYVIFSLAIYELLGRKMYVRYSKYMITQRIIMVVAALILHHYVGLNGIILGYVVSYFVYSFAIYRGFRESKIDFSLVKTRFNFMMNSYVTHVVRVVSVNIDRMIIFPVFGAAILGSYQLGFQIYMLAMLLPNVVFQYVLPQDASGATNKKLKKYTIVVSGIITVLVIAAVPFVIPAFFHEFNETIEVAQIMCLALIPSTLSLIYTSEFLAIEKNKIVLISSGLSVLVLIIGILTLGKYFDVIGMAVAVIIARSSEFILLYWARKRNHYQTKPT